MSNPFGADTVDYGTVSGHGAGFRSGDVDFGSLKERVSNIVMEIKRSTQQLHLEEVKIGTPSDTEEFRGSVQGILRRTLSKVQTGKSMLLQLANLARDSSDRGQGLAIKSLQQSMTSAVNEFHEVSQDMLRCMETSGEPVRIKTRKPYDAHSDTAELSDHHDRARLLRDDRVAQQQQQVLVSDDTVHMEERAELMEQIENDILALNDLMGDMGRLVVEQGEQTDHIETNVEHAYDDVNHGNQQLEKGVRLKRCSRTLKCVIATVVGVILVIILIIVIIVVVEVTKNKKK